VITVASFLVGLPWGPLGVAVAYTIVNYAILVPLTLWNVGLRGPIASKDILKAAFPHAVAIVLCGATLIALPIDHLTLGMCIVLVIYSYVAYALVLVTFHAKRLLLLESLRTFGEMFLPKGQI
jgi:PST family polysaccharide transporter